MYNNTKQTVLFLSYPSHSIQRNQLNDNIVLHFKIKIIMTLSRSYYQWHYT